MTPQKIETVLVTGAEGALGRVVATKFAQAGCKVIGTHAPRVSLSALPQLEGVRWLAVDLADSVALRGKFNEPIDAVIHCAGGFRYAKLDETGDADLDFLIDANLRSTCLLLREIVSGMKRRNFGRIVLVSARATLTPNAGMSVYCATKAGINALTVAMADELKDFNININALLPSMIDTPANRADMPKADFSKWVKPQELAEIMFSLTQPWGAPINGALLPVSGRM